MSCRPKSIAVPPEIPDPAPVDNEPSMPVSQATVEKEESS